MHDDRAIYRNVSEWRALFAKHCAGFRVLREGHVPYKRTYLDRKGEIAVGTAGLQPGVVWFVLLREKAQAQLERPTRPDSRLKPWAYPLDGGEDQDGVAGPLLLPRNRNEPGSYQ